MERSMGSFQVASTPVNLQQRLWQLGIYGQHGECPGRKTRHGAQENEGMWEPITFQYLFDLFDHKRTSDCIE